MRERRSRSRAAGAARVAVADPYFEDVEQIDIALDIGGEHGLDLGGYRRFGGKAGDVETHRLDPVGGQVQQPVLAPQGDHVPVVHHGASRFSARPLSTANSHHRSAIPVISR